ncbi:MAG: hypothetical protein HZA31_13155 [Opitutae bacterium]|nr:hypothetical protein [Opitutae bacterium]
MSTPESLLPEDEPPHPPLKLGTAKFTMVNATGTPTAPENDVHAILHANQQREKAAGLYEVTPPPPRRSRRKRDFWLCLVLGNLVIVGSVGLTSINAVTVIYGFSGVLLFTSGFSWVMWQVMDDY